MEDTLKITSELLTGERFPALTTAIANHQGTDPPDLKAGKDTAEKQQAERGRVEMKRHQRSDRSSKMKNLAACP